MKVWFSAGPQSTQVPDVKERSQKEARNILESAGFKVNAAVKTEDSADIAKDMVTKTESCRRSVGSQGHHHHHICFFRHDHRTEQFGRSVEGQRATAV